MQRAKVNAVCPEPSAKQRDVRLEEPESKQDMGMPQSHHSCLLQATGEEEERQDVEILHSKEMRRSRCLSRVQI